MTVLLAWGVHMLAASTALMALVLALRAPVRRVIGPRLAYILWVLPVARMILPSLPIENGSTLLLAGVTPGRMSILGIGGAGDPQLPAHPALAIASMIALAIWAAGAVAMFGVHAVRHIRFCARLCVNDAAPGAGAVRVVEADVDGPVAFGVFRRFVAVPRAFAQHYDARERELALAHECAHHVRGDLIANWIALAMLAIHWWNPIAWIASAAFHDDQEYAADAHVLAGAEPSALPRYAALLAKAAGAGAPPACSLNARSSLKGRLMMLNQPRRSLPRIALGATLAVLLGGTALAATTMTPVQPGRVAGRRTVTIGVKPDGAGTYALIVDGTSVAPGAALPNGRSLPADFSGAGGCDLSSGARPMAMAIKGRTPAETYTVMCASAGPADVHAALDEGLASLRVMRASVATQKASPVFPEAERTHALAAIDRSIREVQETLAKPG